MRKNDHHCPSILEDVRKWSNKKLIGYFEQMDIPGNNQSHCVIQVLSERFRKLTKVTPNA